MITTSSSSLSRTKWLTIGYTICTTVPSVVWKLFFRGIQFNPPKICNSREGGKTLVASGYTNRADSENNYTSEVIIIRLIHLIHPGGGGGGGG